MSMCGPTPNDRRRREDLKLLRAAYNDAIEIAKKYEPDPNGPFLDNHTWTGVEIARDDIVAALEAARDKNLVAK